MVLSHTDLGGTQENRDQTPLFFSGFIVDCLIYFFVDRLLKRSVWQIKLSGV